MSSGIGQSPAGPDLSPQSESSSNAAPTAGSEGENGRRRKRAKSQKKTDRPHKLQGRAHETLGATNET